MNLKKVIKENLDDLQWIKDIVGETFNIGDTVICKPGFGKVWGSDDYGGSGYKEGKIFTIRNISQDGEVLWPEPEDDPYGVYTKAVELYSEEKMVKENDELDWMRGNEPFQITTTSGKKYWISKETIKTGDMTVYQTASGLWREYGKMNPEKVDDANNYNDYYKVLDLTPLKENDELDWIKEVPDYQLPKNRKDLQQFVGWYFVWDKSNDKSGEWGYGGKRWLIKKIDSYEVWYVYEDLEDQTHESSESISNFLRRIQDGKWVLLSPNNFLLDPWGREYNGIKPIEEKNNINESEDDGLDWIKNVGPKDMTFRVGDIIKVHNVGDEDAFLHWLGDYSDDYLEGHLGENITGEIDYITEERMTIIENNTEEMIFFPTYSDLENLRSNHEDYRELDMYYEIVE